MGTAESKNFFFAVMSLLEWVEARSRELQTGEIRKAADKEKTANPSSEILTQEGATREGANREIGTHPSTEVPRDTSPGWGV